MKRGRGRLPKSKAVLLLEIGAIVDFFPGFEIKTWLYRGKIVEVTPGNTPAQVVYRVQPTHSADDALSPRWIREFDLPIVTVFPKFIRSIVKK